MNLLKRDIKDNKKFSINVSALAGLQTGRALVLDQYLSGINDIPAKDFYHLVISENRNFFQVPDFCVIPEKSAYKDSIFDLEGIRGDQKTIYITNIDLLLELKKLKSKLDIFSISYSRAEGEISSSPISDRFTDAGLSNTSPGVHLALIAGCTEVYYTGTSSSAQTVDLEDIQSFTNQKDPLAPYRKKNFIATDRDTILNLKL